MTNDTELMQAFGEGDESAFDKLVMRHQVGLINFFYRLVWDRARAEDLTQDVFLKLYAHRCDYVPKAKFTTYLYRIARNCWIDFLRRTKSERKNFSLDAESDEGRPLSESMVVAVEDPHSIVGKSELTFALIEAIESLPEEQKLVFVLSEVRGMKYQEIGDTLDIPVGTVKSRMFHAIKRLRDTLGRSMKGTKGPWQNSENTENASKP